MSTLVGEAPKDFLSHCVAASTGNPVLEQIRDKGADAVLAIYRLVKNAFVHAIDNQAVAQAAGQAEQILRDFSATVGGNVSFTFVDDTVFVCGQLLRASRAIYESAVELGGILRRCEVSEVTVEGGVSASNLLAFVSHLVVAVREPSRRGAVLEAKIPHVGARRLQAELEQREGEADLATSERILRLYAASLVVMRQFFDTIASGATILPFKVKRLAQRMVSVSERSSPAFLGMTALAASHRDDAGRAVQSAILAIAVGRQITGERVPLARLAMAALMADVGRVRLAGPEGRDRLVALPEDVEASVPAATSAVCITTGGVNVPNALRTVVTNEATWLERGALLGPPYGKALTPLVEAQVLRMVRALLDHLAPRDAMVEPKSPLDALHAVAATPGMDPVLLRLLVAALGLLPTGTVVEFETGEWGVVVGPSTKPDAVERPLVRLVTDRSGRALSPPREVDLGNPGGNRVFPRITNVIPPRQAKFNVTGVFVG